MSSVCRESLCAALRYVETSAECDNRQGSMTIVTAQALVGNAKMKGRGGEC